MEHKNWQLKDRRFPISFLYTSKESETDSILGLKTNGQGFVADVPHITESSLTPLTLSTHLKSHWKKIC